MKKLSVLFLALLLAVTTTAAFAQTAAETRVTMNAVGGSNVKGQAVITDLGAGRGVRIVVTLTGYQPNQKSAGHIHNTTCTPGGGVAFPLTTITADAQGNGRAESTVATLEYARLLQGPYYVQYHVAEAPPGPQVSCGDVVRTAAAPAQGGGTSLPATGVGGGTDAPNGFPWALVALTLVLGVAGAGYTVVARRR